MKKNELINKMAKLDKMEYELSCLMNEVYNLTVDVLDENVALKAEIKKIANSRTTTDKKAKGS
jgi:hypothetical protein